jgi:hypothetical protein
MMHGYMSLERPRSHPRWAAIWFALLALLVCSAPLPAAAKTRADALSLSVSLSSPSGVTPFKLTGTGLATGSGTELVVIVNRNGGRCPTDFAKDSGQVWISRPVAGAFTVSSASRALEHGLYTVCGWLTSATRGPKRPLVTDRLALSVADPNDVTVSVTPSSVPDGHAALLSVRGVADVTDPVVFVTRKPDTGSGCAAYPSADSGTPLTHWGPADAHFASFTIATSEFLGEGRGGTPDSEPPGRYLLCAWLLDGRGSERSPLAGPAATIVNLTQPTGTLEVTFPELLSVGRRFAVQASFQSNASDARLYVDLKPARSRGAECAASQSLEPARAKLIVPGDRRSTDTTYVEVTRPGVYVACAWLEWVHGTIDGPFYARFVVAGAGQSAVGYVGETSQSLSSRERSDNPAIKLQTIDDQVVNLVYWARYTCTRRGKVTTHPVYPTAFPAFAVSRGGTFTFTFAQGLDVAVITGRLTATGAAGSFAESYPSHGYICRSGAVTFTAKPG